MHFTADKGNIRRPSSYHNCSPGTHTTQPMRLPTPARSRCTYPRCTANEAQVGERAQHSTLLDDHPIFTKHANCSLQPASPRPTGHAGDVRIPSISAHIGPCGAPFALSILDILVGRPLSAWPFTRQSDLQGTARCPLSAAPRRMTTMTVQHRDFRLFCFTVECTSTLCGRILGALGISEREGPLLLSFLLEILDSAPSPSIARPALWLVWQKFGDCSGQLPLTR
jgi:hypothetical protein